MEANKEGQSCLLSGGALDSHCRRSDADILPILAHMTVAAPSQLAHRTLSGAHRTVRCPLPTVGAGHVSPADCAADHCDGDRWLTGQSGAPPDSPVNYSRTPPNFLESDLFTGVHAGAPDTVRCTTEHCLVHHRTLSGAPPDSPVCQTELSLGCTKPSLLHLFCFLLFSVSST